MKKIALLLVAFVMAQSAMSQQFSLPIMPEKMWPSDYARYEADVLNCCNYLLGTDPQYNAPKHEECAGFLLRWLSGTPSVSVVLNPELVDVKNPDLLVAFMASWTRHALMCKNDADLLNAQVATAEMLDYYVAYQQALGKSKLMKRLLKEKSNGNLAAYVTKVMIK